MRRKLLSVALCVCMMLTMVPFAFAAETSSGGSSNISVAIKTEDALKNAISAANNGDTITLEGDITLTSTLKIDKQITLDGAGYTISAGGSDSSWPKNDNVNKHLVLITSNYVTVKNIRFDCKNLAYDVQVYTSTNVKFNNVTIKNSTGAALGVNASQVTAEGTLAMGGASWKDSVNVGWGSSISGVTKCSFDASKAILSEVYLVYSDKDDVDQAGNKDKFDIQLPDSWKSSSDSNTNSYSQEVAEYNGQKYPTLQSAIAAVSTESDSDKTVKLLDDVVLAYGISINKDIVLDLGGKTLSRKGGMLLDIYGDVTIQNGTIAMTNASKTATIWVNQTAKLTVEKSATISCSNNCFSISYYQDCTSAVVTLKGTLTGEGSGITVNGLIKDKDSSNNSTSNKLILDGGTINVSGHGVYQAGYATTTFTENASTITGTTGIEVRAGNLTVTNSTITGNGTFKCEENDNGTTTDGVGIAIAQHTTKLPINVTISGGTISGKYAVYESNPQSNDSTSIGKVKLSITDGKFNGSTAAVYSQDVKDFITGGLFTTDPSNYCGANKTGVPSNDSNYPFTVGELNSKVDVAPATPNAVAKTEGITDTNVKSAMTASAEAAKGTTATGLDAIGGKEATTITDDDITSATNKLSESGVTTTGQGTTVTLYVQPYLDITVTGAEVTPASTEGVSPAITSLSLDITPMVKKIASTATTANGIETGETGKNAVQIGEAQKVTNVNTPVTIKLALPDGFATDGQKLSVKHTKENGSVEYYTGTVTTESTTPQSPQSTEGSAGASSNSKTYVTFTTNGFSPFVIYAASQSAASVNGVIYPSFQEAVNAAQNGDTIILLKSGDVSATMTGSSKTIKVEADTGVTTPINVTVNGETKTLGGGTTEVTFTYTRPSHSSSVSTSTTYNVNVNAATNGTVAADKKTASKGTTVTVTATPSAGYVVDAVKVVDKDGKDVAVTEKNGKYVFTMPGSAVTVTATFKAETPAPSGLPFTDVKSGDWFYDAVKYAYENGLMNGTSATTFAPNGTMNRAMIVTVLYRLEKSPAVTVASKFTDVPDGQWYSDAVAWAAANNIVNGYDETTFGPMNAVTREQMAAILYRYEQYKGMDTVTLEENLNRFPDKDKISAYAVPALQWAVGQKIINGNADGTLDPTGTATRAQVAQIFTNLLNK